MTQYKDGVVEFAVIIVRFFLFKQTRTQLMMQYEDDVIEFAVIIIRGFFLADENTFDNAL